MSTGGGRGRGHRPRVRGACQDMVGGGLRRRAPMGALCPCRLCPRRRLRSPPRGRFRQGWGTQKNNLGRAGALTETRASQTLVSRSGRSEWTSSLCSVSTASSSVTASSGPRLCSSCRKLAPLWAAPRWGTGHRPIPQPLAQPAQTSTAGPTCLAPTMSRVIKAPKPGHVPEGQRRGHGLAEEQVVVGRHLGGRRATGQGLGGQRPRSHPAQPGRGPHLHQDSGSLWGREGDVVNEV